MQSSTLPNILPLLPRTSIHGILNRAFPGRRRPSWTVTANNNSQPQQEQYEIDPEQAKQALRRLDQQLQQLSTKQVAPPKVKASDVEITREQMRQELIEIPGSAVAYVVAALFAFSIFYNILFITFIKPAIDGPELTPDSTIRVEMERYSSGL
ncbi:hypothetical protein LINPERPRIM_LOCUS11763 [Linum perenne]